MVVSVADMLSNMLQVPLRLYLVCILQLLQVLNNPLLTLQTVQLPCHDFRPNPYTVVQHTIMKFLPTGKTNTNSRRFWTFWPSLQSFVKIYSMYIILLLDCSHIPFEAM